MMIRLTEHLSDLRNFYEIFSQNSKQSIFYKISTILLIELINRDYIYIEWKVRDF